jgi:outer membrane protein assembly factor BamB
VQEQNEKAIIIASAAIDPSQTSKSCGQGKKIISYTNKIFVPGYAGFWVYEQNAVGTTTLIKKERAEKSLFGQPASIEDVVFFGGSDGNLYVSSDTGKILTQFAVGPVVGGIAISGNRVYFGTTAGNIDCDAGKILTQFSVGPIWGGIAISGGRVYFGTTAGNIYCMSVNGQ